MTARHRIEAALVRRLPRSASRALGGIYGFALPARRSYSQFGEDLIITSFFAVLGRERGTYVDIGAFHPKWLSNTHLLAKRGWSGVVVDIDAEKVQLCTRVRKRCVGIVAAVAPKGSDAALPIYKFDRLWSEIDTLSETDALRYRETMGIGFVEEKVDTVSVNDVLAKAVAAFGEVHLLNIDVEGVDEQILGEIDFDTFPVDVVCFEDNERFGGSDASVGLLTSRGYRHVATCGGSHIYARGDLADQAVRFPTQPS
jgi:hypothetical protein